MKNTIDSLSIPSKVSDLTNDTGFITSSSLPTKVSDLTNDTGFITSSSLPTKVSDLTNDTGFITSASLPTKTSDLQNDGDGTNAFVKTNDSRLTDARTPVTHTHTKSQITDFPSLSTVATSGSYNDLSNKPTIPTVPTNVSAFTNDVGYLTQHQSLSNYVQKSSTTGLLRNDGTVDTTSYATSSQISSMLTDSDIVDNLTTSDATKVLSAKQGKELKDLIGSAISYINQ